MKFYEMLKEMEEYGSCFHKPRAVEEKEKSAHMKFWEALKEMQENGKKVRKPHWTKEYLYWDGTDVRDEGDHDMGRLTLSWFVTEIWEIYEEPPKTSTWQEVLLGLREGKRFSRRGLCSTNYIFLNKKGEVLMTDGFPIYSLEDFEAADWVEVKE